MSLNVISFREYPLCEIKLKHPFHHLKAFIHCFSEVRLLPIQFPNHGYGGCLFQGEKENNGFLLFNCPLVRADVPLLSMVAAKKKSPVVKMLPSRLKGIRHP
ncbi:hypothetical protein D3C75_1065340 [compost metagenome]